MLTSNISSRSIHAADLKPTNIAIPRAEPSPAPPPSPSPSPTQRNETPHFVLNNNALFLRGVCVGDAPVKFWARYLEDADGGRRQRSKSQNGVDAPTTSTGRSSSATSNSRHRPQPKALQLVTNSALSSSEATSCLELQSENDSFRVLVQWSSVKHAQRKSGGAVLDFDFVASRPVRLFEVYAEVCVQAPASSTVGGPVAREAPGTSGHFNIHGKKYHRRLRRQEIRDDKEKIKNNSNNNSNGEMQVSTKVSNVGGSRAPSSASKFKTKAKKEEEIWRAFSQGFQSWTYSRSRGCETDKQSYSIASRVGLSSMYLDTDASKFGHSDGVKSSSVILMRATTMQDSFVFGATSTRVAVTEVWCASHGTDATVSFIVDYEGKRVPVSKSQTVFSKILKLKQENLNNDETDGYSSGQDDTTGTDTDTDTSLNEQLASNTNTWHHNDPVKRHHHVLHGERLVVLRSRSEHAALDWYAELCTTTAFNGVPRNHHLLPTSTQGAARYDRGQDHIQLSTSASADQLGTSASAGTELKDNQGTRTRASSSFASLIKRKMSRSTSGNKTQMSNLDSASEAEASFHESSAANNIRTVSEQELEISEEYTRLQDLGRAPCGWGSWYQFLTKVKETDMHDMIDHFKNDDMLNSVVDFIQLDDGYASALGDWTTPNARKFPSGLNDLARRIRAAGFAPGIWTAPFMAGKSSKLLREHRDWFLRHPAKPSKVLMAHFNPAWGLLKDAYTYCLDLSHPEVLDHLFKTFRSLREAGFVLFKVDFLLAGMRHGIRYNPNITRVEAYLNGLMTIRRAIGAGGFLLGCGAPLAPVQTGGIFDAMRVSRDTAGSWNEQTILRIVGTDCPNPCVRGAMQGNMTRWFMHRHAWQFNDPDCLVLRKSALSTDQVIAQITLLAMTGGLLTFTDDMRTLSADRVDLARKVLPPARLCGWPLEFMDVDHANVFVCMEPKQRSRGGVLAMVNWAIPSFKKITAHDTHSFNVDAAWRRALGAAKVWHVGLNEVEGEGSGVEQMDAPPPLTFCFDFWREKMVCTLREENNNNNSDNNNNNNAPTDNNEAVTLHVPPHAVTALQVTPCFKPHMPCVVGTNVHLLAVADGMLTWSIDEDKHQLIVKSHTVLYANVPRSVWVVVPHDCCTGQLMSALEGYGELQGSGCVARAKRVGLADGGVGVSEQVDASPLALVTAKVVGDATLVEVVVSSDKHVEDWEFVVQW